MKKFQKILVASTLFSIAGVALADEPVITEPGNTYKTYLPTSVRAEVGTTGYGGALTWDVNPYVGVSLGITVEILIGVMILKVMEPNTISIRTITITSI